jgi:hypothetical protein
VVGVPAPRPESDAAQLSGPSIFEQLAAEDGPQAAPSSSVFDHLAATHTGDQAPRPPSNPAPRQF